MEDESLATAPGGWHQIVLHSTAMKHFQLCYNGTKKNGSHWNASHTLKLSRIHFDKVQSKTRGRRWRCSDRRITQFLSLASGLIAFLLPSSLSRAECISKYAIKMRKRRFCAKSTPNKSPQGLKVHLIRNRSNSHIIDDKRYNTVGFCNASVLVIVELFNEGTEDASDQYVVGVLDPQMRR